MKEDPISLGKLAYACRVYDAMTDYGSSFRKFRLQVDDTLDLANQNHRQALLQWLNACGCRHLALKCHQDVSNELAAWYKVARGRLPGSADRLVGTSDAVLEQYAELFDDLSSLPAREGVRNGRRFPISFGPTAASKTLFALRPHVFLAWDEAIRQELVPDDSDASYVEFLKGASDDLRDITEQSSRRGIDLENLQKRLGRPESTAPQLMGEYYWITITQDVKPPGLTTLGEWLDWS